MTGTVGFCHKNLDPDVPENWTYVPVEDGGMELGKNWLPSMEPRINYETNLTFKREFIVGGRGHGKTARQRQAELYFAGHKVEESAKPSLTMGIFLKAIEDGRRKPLSPVYYATAWEYEVLERAGYNMFNIVKYGPPTPREELRERLMTKLRGDDPGEPYNWKGLK